MTAIVSFPGPTGLVDQLELRRNLAGLVVRDSSGNPRAGVFPRSTSAIVSATASTGPMTVSVAAFEAALVRENGPLFMANDGAVAVSLATAPVSNSRIDVIYARQNESAAPMSDGADTAVIAAATGTAAASPVKPSIPTGALELATVLVPTGVSATNAGGVVITQTAPFTAAAGGTVLLRSSAEQTAWTPGDGSAAYRFDTGAELLRVAGAWKRTNPAMGVFSATTDASGLAYITHGMGATPTIVQLTSVHIDDVAAPLQMISIGALTSTQIQVVAHRNDANTRLAGTAITLHWVAWP